MKQTTLIKSAVLAGSALLAGLASAGDDPAPAASSDLEVSIGVGYNSEYIFRSLNFGDDLFTASIGLSGSGSLLGIGDLELNAGIDLLTTTTSEGGGHELRVGASATPVGPGVGFIQCKKPSKSNPRAQKSINLPVKIQ